MGAARTVTLAARTTDLATPTVAALPSSTSGVIGLLNDRKTIVARSFNNIALSVDNLTTRTLGKNFNDSTWTPDGLLELPNGEVLVSVSKSSDIGEVWRSTGWNPATFQATSWARVIQCSGIGVAVRAVWGMHPACIAPTWSKHAGMILVGEYGTHVSLATAPDLAAVRVRASFDGGVTFRTIFDLRDRWTSQPTYTRLHVHSVAYDPWFNRVLVAAGDGGNATPGSCGVWYSDNPEATTPTWTPVHPSLFTTTSRYQVTTIFPTEAGIALGADGLPQGIHVLPRAGGGRYGAPKTSLIVSGKNDGFIAGGFYRNGGLETPQPGSPIFATFIEPTTNGTKPAVYMSNDLFQWREVYRHSTVTSNGAPGMSAISGPTLGGKVIGQVNVTGTPQFFSADYTPTFVPIT